RRLRPRARLLPDDRRRDGSRRAPRPGLPDDRARRRRLAAHRGQDRRALAGRARGPALRTERGRPLREDGAQRHRVRDHGRVRGGAERDARPERRQGGRPARQRGGDSPPRARVLPVRHRRGRGGRGLAPRVGRRLLASRPDGERSRRRSRARRFRRTRLRLGGGALDDPRRHRGGRADAGALDGALRALRVPRRGRVCRQAALRDEEAVRRTRGAGDGRQLGVAAHEIETLGDAEAVAKRGAELIAEWARAGANERGRFTLAVSGGRTPWVMFRYLSSEDVPWEQVELYQVDERIAPAGDPDRNLTHLDESLPTAARASLRPMPVEASDLERAAADYAASLPASFDAIHLGLGDDGHTASLVPGDAVLGVTDRDVALTDVYLGRRRMTLTYPVLDRAAQLLWLVTGPERAGPLARLRAHAPSIPAGRVNGARSLILADRAATNPGE